MTTKPRRLPLGKGLRQRVERALRQYESVRERFLARPLLDRISDKSLEWKSFREALEDSRMEAEVFCRQAMPRALVTIDKQAALIENYRLECMQLRRELNALRGRRI